MLIVQNKPYEYSLTYKLAKSSDHNPKISTKKTAAVSSSLVKEEVLENLP